MVSSCSAPPICRLAAFRCIPARESWDFNRLLLIFFVPRRAREGHRFDQRRSETKQRVLHRFAAVRLLLFRPQAEAFRGSVYSFAADFLQKQQNGSGRDTVVLPVKSEKISRSAGIRSYPGEALWPRADRP